jgi:hypothetical protein
MLEQKLSYEAPKKRSWLRNAILGLAVGLVGLVGGCGCESIPGRKAADKGQDVYFLDNKLEEISTNVVLPKAVYMIDFDIEVKPKATLEIKPGAELRFGPKVGLACYGVLKAQGTEKDRIIFGGYGQERWSNIMLIGQDSNNSLLEYCTIRGGGGRKIPREYKDIEMNAENYYTRLYYQTNGSCGGGLLILDSSPTTRNCIIENNTADNGGGVSSINGSPIIENNIIRKNEVKEFGGGIDISGNLKFVNAVIRGNKILDNLEGMQESEGMVFRIFMGGNDKSTNKVTVENNIVIGGIHEYMTLYPTIEHRPPIIFKDNKVSNK